MKRVGNKCGGYIVSTEMLIIATILVFGMIIGLVLVRNAILAPGSLDDDGQDWSFVAAPVNENGLGVTLGPPPSDIITNPDGSLTTNYLFTAADCNYDDDVGDPRFVPNTPFSFIDATSGRERGVNADGTPVPPPPP